MTRARPGDGEPRRLGEVLDEVGRELGLPPTGSVTVLDARWPEIVGEALAAHVVPGALRAGVLSLHADAPAWAAELRWLRADVLRRLAEVLGPGVVRDLRVVVGGPPTRAS